MDGSWWWLLPVPVWFGLAAVLLLELEVRPWLRAAEPGPELPPALLEYLSIRCHSGLAGVAATVHDLIGRGHLLLLPGDPDLVLRAPEGPDPLQPWEQLVLDLAERRELPGVGVPLPALVSGDDAELQELMAAFEAEVGRAAVTAGLVRPRLTVLRGVILAVTGPAAVALTFSWGGRSASAAWPIALPVVAGLLAAVFSLGRRQRTVPGRRMERALRRRLAEREQLEEEFGSRALANLIAVGLVRPDQHLVWVEPHGSAWSPASGGWEWIEVKGFGPGGPVGPAPVRVTGVVVQRRRIAATPSRWGDEQWWIAVDDGRSGEAMDCRCSAELYELAPLGTWLELDVDPAAGWAEPAAPPGRLDGTDPTGA